MSRNPTQAGQPIPDGRRSASAQGALRSEGTPNEGAAPSPSGHAQLRDPMAVKRLVSDTGWLIRLRWLAALGMVLATLLTQYAFGIGVGTRQLLLLALLLAACNAFFRQYFAHLKHLVPNEHTLRRARRFVHVQIVVDLVILTAALHYCGGIRNPIVIFYIFHVILASILLPPGASYFHAALGAALFLSLGIIEHVRPELHWPLKGYDWVSAPTTWRLLLGEVLILALALYVAAYLAGTLSRMLHKREGELVRTLASLRERTHELKATNTKLSEVQARKEHFLHHAAHQLKSPLSAIDGCIAAVLGDYAVEEEKRKDLLRRARVRIASLCELVGDLLLLSRAREGVLPEGERRPVDLSAVVQKVADLLSERARQKGVCLSFQAAPGCSQVIGQENALRDVVLNLVSNAVEYTTSSGRVKIKAFPEGPNVILEVIDTGIGIPPEERDHLFTEFFRASNARALRPDGTGLGLAIVKEIVEQHGGSISVDSLLNLGTCMRVSLPHV
ncbi:MAG: HAMP domain-containing sensor histidine kinase [Planctomycetota bacterium]